MKIFKDEKKLIARPGKKCYLPGMKKIFFVAALFSIYLPPALGETNCLERQARATEILEVIKTYDVDLYNITDDINMVLFQIENDTFCSTPSNALLFCDHLAALQESYSMKTADATHQKKIEQALKNYGVLFDENDKYNCLLKDSEYPTLE